MIRVAGLKIPVDGNKTQLEQALLKKLGISGQELLDFKIYKQSVDARKAGIIYFVYTVDVKLAKEDAILKKLRNNRDVSVSPRMVYEYVKTGQNILTHRPVIAGTGPAGLFAGLLLGKMGYRPLLLERGGDVDTRIAAVKKFWETGKLDPECNVQFGEGGAGTFSDGKLTTLIKDVRCRKVLEVLIEAGAPEEIIYSYKPHIGTDKLRTVVKNIRRQITELGGEIRFGTKVTDLVIKDGRITGVTVNNNEVLDVNVLVLALGHSARDTFEMLLARGVEITPKAFSIGVRIEHPQEQVNLTQYKELAGHKNLGAADYKLAYHASNGRSAYTFCMCPGGVVVAAASEEGCVVTNGMSEYARDAENANSALLVGVSPRDFPSDHPLAGVEFQRKWESKAFHLGGGNYCAPAQLVGDFLADRPSVRLGAVKPSYKKAVQLSELKRCLPDYVIETLREAIPALDKKMRGFARPDAVMTGVETRSSSPIRIIRDENFETRIKGLYPAGEGAGYAGGIVSAAVDGIKVAEAIAKIYAPFS
ncbi:MAG: ribulose-1,5-biphosphate synthetase [Pelotomaculum sp. PtaB.Bin013]|uniref:NAD(P)/FAD-dependent oxidoreductase n=1 Tax=Pelotomaculum isophthalicicum JI TaxID=947010 RepID=A0A9X4H2L7_9FIRM|nr:NAD(P)/FAD-dependent oxidoreductase [Pelotomaculum isophthalicicum]MDF9408491.1 NAD(P)/FAD-dependent oxidoreductase [Pelotomaculum isophthalicicum JI]OPX91499.1 MAG: ribulose-1,5-biphosphate synthetase [Pelotomaculum sp. PtaB.Bin013]